MNVERHVGDRLDRAELPLEDRPCRDGELLHEMVDLQDHLTLGDGRRSGRPIDRADRGRGRGARRERTVGEPQLLGGDGGVVRDAVDRMEAGEDVLPRRVRTEDGGRIGMARARTRARPVFGGGSQQGLFGPAALGCVAAAGRKAAPDEVAREVRGQAGDRVERLRAVVIETWDRAEERLRVRMPHRAEELVRRRALRDLAGVHHHHPVRALRDHAEVVRDQDHGHLEVTPERVDQIEDLRLDGHVERGRRLVGDQHPRRAREGDCDHHTLTQAAGQLVGVVAEPFVRTRHADEVEHFARTVERLLLRNVLMQPHCLGDLAPDRPGRVEGGHRVLEDHRDLVAAHAAHLPFREGDEVTAEEPHGAADDVTDVRQQLHDREPGGRLAAARLADEAHALPLGDAERHPVNGLHVGRPEVKLRLEVLDLEDDAGCRQGGED